MSAPPLDLSHEPWFEAYLRAFSAMRGSCRDMCRCDRQFYNPSGNWDFEEGEIQELEAEGATALDWSVEFVIVDGLEYVSDCTCWHERARKIVQWVNGHADAIAVFLTLEKARLQAEADRRPTVEGTVVEARPPTKREELLRASRDAKSEAALKALLDEKRGRRAIMVEG